MAPAEREPSSRPVFGEDWLVAVLDALEEAVIAFDAEARTIAANPAAEALFGFSVDEQRGAPLERLLRGLSGPKGEALDDPAHPLRHAAAQALPRRGILCSLVTDAGPRQLRVNVNVLPPSGPYEATDLVISFFDISELVRAEASAQDYARELEEANVQLRQLDEIKSDLMSTTSHELRTPLATILGHAELLDAHWDALDEGERRRSVGDIREHTSQLLQIVDDLLTATRLASGSMRVRPDVVSVRSIVGDVVAAAATRAAITVDVDPDISVQVDEDHARRMLRHLVDNALRHGGGGVEICGDARPDAVELAVCDGGPGVAKEFLPHLFERFTQASIGVSRRADGTGVGLAIVKGLAELNDGSVRYEPNAPRGARFVLTLQPG